MASHQRLGAVLLLLGMLSAAYAKTNLVPGRPGLSDVLQKHGIHQGARSPKVAVASTGSTLSDDLSTASYGYPEEKELCLTETSRKYCSDPGTADPTSVFWTSGFSCCHDDDYSYGDYSGGKHIRTWGTDDTIGSCDWMATYGTGITITANLARLGSASAVCYFGGDAGSCGGPLCDKLVMSLDGVLYQGAAYSYWGNAQGAVDDSCDINGGGPNFPFPRAGQRNATSKTKRAPNPAATLRPGAAKIQYSGGHHDSILDNNRDVYTSTDTIMISGIVSSMAGQHSDEYSGGCFEYVVSFATDGNAVTGGLDPTLPWVRDKSYKMTFYKRSSYTS